MTGPQRNAGHRVRAVALRVTRAAQHRGAGLQAVLNRELTAHQTLSPQDKHLITELSYGYLRMKGRLDAVLSWNLSGNSRKLPPAYLNALGLAVYELLYLDRIPPYATLDVTVQRIKAVWGKGLAGLANALLRKILSKQADLQRMEYYQDRSADALEWLSSYYSCPAWLIRILLNSLGREQTETVLRQSLRPPMLGIRVNQTQPGAKALFERLQAEANPLIARFPALGFRRTPEHIHRDESKGLCSRQSLAAQTALSSLSPCEWVRPVWDACCGFGGKTCQLLETGLDPVWASDRSVTKVQACRREIRRLALPETVLLCADATHPPPLSLSPGTVLLDVPCSGLGVLNRRPDIKWKHSPSTILELRQLQADLLRSACDATKSRGQIVYLTCTLNKEENTETIRRILKEYPEKILLEHEYATPVDSLMGEYFYAAVLRKR